MQDTHTQKSKRMPLFLLTFVLENIIIFSSKYVKYVLMVVNFEINYQVNYFYFSVLISNMIILILTHMSYSSLGSSIIFKSEEVS